MSRKTLMIFLPNMYGQHGPNVICAVYSCPERCELDQYECLVFTCIRRRRWTIKISDVLKMWRANRGIAHHWLLFIHSFIAYDVRNAEWCAQRWIKTIVKIARQTEWRTTPRPTPTAGMWNVRRFFFSLNPTSTAVARFSKLNEWISNRRSTFSKWMSETRSGLASLNQIEINAVH